MEGYNVIIPPVKASVSEDSLALEIEMQGHWAERAGPAQEMSLADAETLGANH